MSMASKHSVEDKFTHAGGERLLCGFTFCTQALLEFLENGIGAEQLHQAQDLDELALARLAHTGLSRRRRVANSSSKAQSASGAAWSSAPILRSGSSL
jgi:hypothetical protein